MLPTPHAGRPIEERVVPDLDTDQGLGPVPRMDARPRGDRREAPEGPGHRRGIAEGQVGATDRAGEEEVSAEAVPLADERDVTRRVTGEMPDGESHRPEREHVALVQFAVRRSRLLERDAVVPR